MIMRWIPQKPHKHFGVCPAWEVQEYLSDIDNPDDLYETLNKTGAASGWYQIKNGSGRTFCYWSNVPEKDKVILRGLHVSDVDPPMVAVGSGWVRKDGDRYTGEVRDVRWGDMHLTDWEMFTGGTYQFLKILAEQMKKEQG